MTGTPSVSRRSQVAGRSRIDFAPAQTTIIGVRASSARSADSSNGASRWTPPIPPVANTSIPARLASESVAATVVAPSQPRGRGERNVARRHFAHAVAPQKALELLGLETDRRRAANDGRDRRHRAGAFDRRRPSARRPRDSAESASPCASTELSSATTGVPVRRAALRTLGRTRMHRASRQKPRHHGSVCGSAPRRRGD